MGAACAYVGFENDKFVPPPRFKLADRFTEWAGIVGSLGTEERFGLIFQSTTNPGMYLIAFRGTTTKTDLLSIQRPLSLTGEKTFPKDVNVESGFHSVYTGVGGGMVDSMQGQMFKKLASYQDRPSIIITCGHSLDGALASPRVGGQKLADCGHLGGSGKTAKATSLGVNISGLPS